MLEVLGLGWNIGYQGRRLDSFDRCILLTSRHKLYKVMIND